MVAIPGSPKRADTDGFVEVSYKGAITTVYIFTSASRPDSYTIENALPANHADVSSLGKSGMKALQRGRHCTGDGIAPRKVYSHQERYCTEKCIAPKRVIRTPRKFVRGPKRFKGLQVFVLRTG